MIRRRAFDIETNQVVDDTRICPGSPQHKTIVRLLRRFPHVRTEFTYLGEAVASVDEWNPSPREARQLHTQAKMCFAVHTHKPKDRCLVMEVFSPRRFAKEAEAHGFRSRSYDLKTGFDLRTNAHRRQVEQDLVNDPPALLVLCPPCTNEGGCLI